MWYSSRFTVVQKHMVEFSQVALANASGSEDMLNRVMTKDNVGVAVLLEVNKEMFTGGEGAAAWLQDRSRLELRGTIHYW